MFVWRNDPLTRVQSHTTAPVLWGEHVLWLEGLSARGIALYIALDGETPVGTIRVNPGEPAELSWTIAPDARGMGYGTSMLRAVLALYPGTPFCAEIKHDNTASQRIAEKCGFVRAEARDGYAVWKRH